MSILLKEITEYNNLYWAWEKAKWCYKPGDIWFNELEVALFEANLLSELNSISSDILNGTYKLGAIQAVPFPKAKNEQGTRTRQTFWIPVRDQVTWIAVVNVVGKYLDSEMPFWSYGNRLFVPVFKKEADVTWRFGFYRNTTKNIFRTWKQSWPLFRRHINITAKLLSKRNEMESLELDDVEKSLLETNQLLQVLHPLNVKYLKSEYWNIEFDGKLFWASLDFEKFYPRINQLAIIRNFRIYLGKVYTQEFDRLLLALLKFPTDYKDWTEQELIDMTIADQSEYYLNMPTGLFVAGFLANVSLMEIDAKVSIMLETRRNIAHFRYVDDHVILGKKFEDVISWIEEYKAILMASDTGASFNTGKTKPESLAKYFEAKEKEVDRNSDNDSIVEIANKDAQKEMLLDPDFPAPLMTQTLTKVSRLNQTNFQLLTPQEETNLISDVEHLLITDFPDEELRKDTRVSFAAKMLSTIVPEATANMDKLYELEKSLVATANLISSKKVDLRSISKTSERKLINEYLKLLLETQGKIKLEIKACYKELKASETKIGEKTLKLLKKAIRENHEKIRLWTRILEFGLKMGLGSTVDIPYEVEMLSEKKEASDLSAKFLYSLIMQIVSSLLIQGFNIIVSSHSSTKRKVRAKAFVKGVLCVDFIGYFDKLYKHNSKGFENISFDVFRFTSGSIIYLLNKEGFDEFRDCKSLVKKFRLIDWENNPRRFCNRTGYAFSIWTLWITSKLERGDEVLEPYLWKEICDGLTFKNDTDFNVVEQYPRHLSKRILRELDSISISKPFFSNEGALYDIYKTSRQTGIKDNFKFLKEIGRKSKKVDGCITICDWIDNMKVVKNKLETPVEGKLIFDPRLSEWAALEIVAKITILLISKIEAVPIGEYMRSNTQLNISKCIHPNNILISEIVISELSMLTWEKLRRVFDSASVELRPVQDLIIDERFSPTIGISGRTETQAAIAGVCSLLICLLTMEYSLPGKWNPLGHQNAWVGLYRARLKEVPVSTYTRNIIDGCFSKKNAESILWNSYDRSPESYYADDTENDPPTFWKLADLLKYIRHSQVLLQKQQIAVSEHQPRQLIPIKLRMLKRNSFQIINEEE